MNTLHHIFETYERKFSEAIATLPLRMPWIEEERGAILSIIQEKLGIRDAWIPEIIPHVVATSHQNGYWVEHLQSTSWPGCHGAAFLYRPNTDTTPSLFPAVILACGHGAGGKQAPFYALMAASLARRGIVVLVSDNIGQGERSLMGHADSVQVFECGLSIQGLIVMETIGWLNWLRKQNGVDNKRIGVIGNSGGGTLALFLGALRRDELAVVSSSGYPSTFEFIARKEKKHCHCNLLPGIVGELEMWQVYGCIAPKPLFLFQGRGDSLFPCDLFQATARKVCTAYEQRGATEHFTAEIFDGAHSWDANRIHILTDYLCRQFKIPLDQDELDHGAALSPLTPCFSTWPMDAKTIDEVAMSLSGKVAVSSYLAEVFPPVQPPPQDKNPYLRGDAAQIFAQFEAFLK